MNTERRPPDGGNVARPPRNGSYGSGGQVLFRTVKVVEGIMAVLSLIFALGTPILSLHDRVNRIEHVQDEQSARVDAVQRTYERHDATIQQLSERWARIEAKIDDLHEQLGELRNDRRYFGDEPDRSLAGRGGGSGVPGASFTPD